jgi:hypothetical protein
VPAASSPRLARTDNLVALEMGGRVESRERVTLEYAPTRALDGKPNTFWLTGGSSPSIVLSFIGRDTALVGGVSVTFPQQANDPIGDKPFARTFPTSVEVWTSMQSPTEGFQKAVAAPLPQDLGEHAVALPAPVEARYVKLVFPANAGAQPLTAVAEIVVREGQAAGYVPLLKRHPDLAALLSSGKLPSAPGATDSSAIPAPVDPTSCARPARLDVHPTRPESHNVLVVGHFDFYAPYDYSIDVPNSPDIRYFPSAPGDGHVDSSIFRRATYWPVPAEAASPAALLPSANVDTVVLEQICDIKTSLPGRFKRALDDWVAQGHKLIIQDSDNCGEGNKPDYSFLPFPFATSNPGSRGAASALRVVESNFIASPDSKNPAFFDEENWRLRKNGNISNDFGDSNTVVKFDPHWCGMLVGSNANGAMGFVVTYAHWGHGLILYDGLDRDQAGNVAYRQYVARQLLLPFDPDGLPCSTRLSPFVVTTDPMLVSTTVMPGQTLTYPLAIQPVQPDYKGTVKLTFDPAPEFGGLQGHIDPETVTVAPDTKATLTVTLPQTLPPEWHMALRGASGDATSTLCLAAATRRTGHVSVQADLGAQPPEQSRKNLLVILDLSGSMNLPLGKSTRIKTAREVLHDVLARVPDDFHLGLRLYGNRFGSKQKQTCTDSQLVIPVQANARADILKTIDTSRPRGETPLVYSVLQAIDDLKRVGGGGVVLITDGEESCGGDFTAATKAIRDSGLDFRLNIVGFTLTGQKAKDELGSLTSATGGHFYTAADGPALSRAVVAATISRFPYSIVDAAGTVVAEGEAGDTGQDVPPAQYKLIVKAGEESMALDGLSVELGKDVGVRIVHKGDGFAVVR